MSESGSIPSAAEFSVVVERNDDVGLMRIVGELDIETHQQVLDAIRDPSLDGVTQWAIDCSDLSFVDSGGLRALLSIAGQAGGLPNIALYDAQPQLLRLLEAAGLLEAFTIRSDVATEPPSGGLEA